MRRWTTFRSTGASRATSASSRAPKATTGWVTVHHVLLSLVLCTSCRPQLAWAGEGAADRHSQPARSDRAVPKPARAATRPPPRRATTCGTTLIQVGPPIPGVCKLGGGAVSAATLPASSWARLPCVPCVSREWAMACVLQAPTSSARFSTPPTSTQPPQSASSRHMRRSR